jgi:hypothetical protein
VYAGRPEFRTTKQSLESDRGSTGDLTCRTTQAGSITPSWGTPVWPISGRPDSTGVLPVPHGSLAPVPFSETVGVR